MPIYEYKCKACGAVRDAIRPVAQCKEPLTDTCEKDSKSECVFDRILSPTPTTFAFNDHKGYEGLEKRTRGR